MAKSPSTANWQTIDPETLPAPVAKQYLRYKETYKEMKMDRDTFEQAMRDIAPAPTGKRLVFGYNFGKLSVALVDDDAKPTSAKGTTSLSAFLATQATLGKRT
jgi:phage baseplate assembly protein W